MGVYEELQERGLIAQITNEDEVRELINNGKAVFYIGFDPTADSLHVGHFMALCLMKRLQMAGNKPIALIGGGTGMIGDPSGKTDMRKMLTPEIIQHNCDCFKKQMSKFIDFSDGKAMMVNNADWLLDLNYINVLREVGACFSVNRMLSFECYKQRMERGSSPSPAAHTISPSWAERHSCSSPCAYLASTRPSPCIPISKLRLLTPESGIPHSTATASALRLPSALPTSVPISSSALPMYWPRALSRR